MGWTSKPKKPRKQIGRPLKRKFNVGKKLGDLTVVAHEQDARGRSVYRCRCVCGREVTRRSYIGEENLTNNCGCKPRGKWRGSGPLSQTHFYRVRRMALLRDLVFEVTIEDLASLFEKQEGRCAMTGEDISFGKRTAHRSTASLDRIDSNKGYTLDNVWWVHRDVNRMKMDLPYPRFLDLVHAIAQLHPRTT